LKVGILGAGLSGLSLAFFLQKNKKIKKIDLLEKEQKYGGLCRSFKFDDIYYDIGPHVIFSRDKEILELMVNLLGNNVNKLRRSNKIFFKGRFVKYPFENELSALPDEDKSYCLNSFLNNPYEDYKPDNMLQFFLSTFGEGITNSYLRPYNEKIWKFDPAFIDTQMVERIPKPPREDIINSAKGVQTEGYLHQLFFYYPKKKGIESLAGVFADKLDKKVTIHKDFQISNINRFNGQWIVRNTQGFKKKYDLIISTIPLPVLTEALGDIVPDSVRNSVADLKYNSIIICVLKLDKDNLGNNFAVMVPDKEIIFHRLSKINYLFQNTIKKSNSTILLAEITYRQGNVIDNMTDEDIKSRVLSDLTKMRFIGTKANCSSYELKRFEYAYVIYDLTHKKNMKIIKEFYEKQMNIMLSGRFGEFEYLNMDQVLKRSQQLANKLKRQHIG